LLDEALGNFGGRQVHLVEGAEQSQQIEPGRFQSWAEVGRDLEESRRRHGPSRLDRGAEVKDVVSGRQRSSARGPGRNGSVRRRASRPTQRPGKPCAAGRGVPSCR
jgi:hypothetical protein